MFEELQRAALSASNRQKIQRLRQTRGQAEKASQQVPRFVEPVANSREYQVLGEAVGMNSREVQLLMTAIFEDPNEVELDLIKKLLLIAKLKHSKATIEYHDQLIQRKAMYEQELKRVSEAQYKLVAVEAEIAALLDHPDYVNVKDVWVNVVDQLRAALAAVDGKVYGLPEPERELFMIITKSSRFANTKFNDDAELVEEVEWDTIRDRLHVEHISDIVRKWALATAPKPETTVDG